MIEPSGTPISLPPNRQGKAPAAGSKGPVGQRQTIDSGAQDDPAGFTGGVGDEGPGKTNVLDTCARPAQWSGSAVSKFPAPLTPLSVGAMGEGKSAVDGNSPEIRSSKAQGQQPKLGRGDIGVGSSQLPGFPAGIIG